MRHLVIGLCLASVPAFGQFDMQHSGTTASLRGIDSVGKGIAWASGTGGTVLRTEDGGYLWQRCNTPPGAEKLDFRGVQAFDENTAIVMSSGKGDLSRIYKTTDGCATWKLVFTNPDKDGFFDGINVSFPSQDQIGRPLTSKTGHGYLLGDPVDGLFVLYATKDGGDTWQRRVQESKKTGCKIDTFPANEGEAAFAASNESLVSANTPYPMFVTGGSISHLSYSDVQILWDGASCHDSTHQVVLPLASGHSSQGAFAVGISPVTHNGNQPTTLIVVGGDYAQPSSDRGTSATVRATSLRSFHVTASSTPPHGYRSAVAYDAASKAWITVGPNGTDVSTDDGKNWRALKPGANDDPGADKDWNALSLPFVVGPKGRIGVLQPGVLKQGTK